MMRFVFALLVGAAFNVTGLPPQSVVAATLAAQTSDTGGVRVVVKPKSVGAGVPVWEFEVTTDTHTTPLNVDFVKASVIIDESSRRYTPTAWEGDPPGGHHRKGILKFSAAGETAKSIELQITGIGGSGTRIFHWKLAK